MSTEQNKALISRLYEKLNEEDLSNLCELFTDDFVDHTGLGACGIEETVVIMRGMLPDLRFSVEDTVAEGDKVAVRVCFTGSRIHGTVTFGGTYLFRIREGKIAERWGHRDRIELTGIMALV